jgi:nicotinate-nucleotide pyrophosphorylase (carboxylating)
MFPFPSIDELKDLIQLARREDLGPAGDDVTSRLTLPAEQVGVGTLLQKDVGVVCGLPIVEMVCRAYDERLRVEMIPGFHMEIIEGRFSDQRTTPLLRVRGPVRSLLSAERVVLNFIQHMSGVATQTQRFVRRIAGTRAKIYDTRKTKPGFRALDKYAVRCGGGFNHRVGLYDGLLAKDNHLAGVAVRDLKDWATRIVSQCRAEDPARLIEIEVTALEQFQELLKVEGIHVILLDNMDCPRMENAVQMRDASNRRGQLELEASGGVTLETVRPIAMTGVERIAVGGITHSAPALDISFEIEV